MILVAKQEHTYSEGERSTLPEFRKHALSFSEHKVSFEVSSNLLVCRKGIVDVSFEKLSLKGHQARLGTHSTVAPRTSLQESVRLGC